MYGYVFSDKFKTHHIQGVLQTMMLFNHDRPLLFLLILLTALALDLLAGDPPTRYHPVGWLGQVIQCIWAGRLSSKKVHLLFCGTLILSTGLLLTTMISWPLQRFLLSLRGIPLFVAIIISAIVFKLSFSLKGLLHASSSVKNALDSGNLPRARQLASQKLVSRTMEDADEAAVVSAVIESLSENFTDSLASPIFYFSIGGLPAAWGYRFINTADAMLGYHGGDKEWGGKITARLDDVLNWIPARISGWIFIIASGLTSLEGRLSSKCMLTDAMKCASPNSGWTMAAAAGILGIRLEKKGHYVLNSHGRLPVSADIDRCINLVRISSVLLLISVILCIVLVLIVQ